MITWRVKDGALYNVFFHTLASGILMLFDKSVDIVHIEDKISRLRPLFWDSTSTLNDKLLAIR